MEKTEKYTLDEFSFSSRTEYERAQKEKETIAYITANTNMADMKALLKVYNRAVENKSFQTVIGLEFMKNIRKRLTGSGFIGEQDISHVPVVMRVQKVMEKPEEKPDADTVKLQKQVEKYRSDYENAKAGSVVKNICIGVLIVVIAAMVIITAKTKYSVFTYFTDYERKMENELIDKYETWEQELEQREQALQEKE